MAIGSLSTFHCPPFPVKSMPVNHSPSTEPTRWARAFAALRPSHAHTAFSATLVLMVSTFLSRIIGLVRVKYILWLFGRGMTADALNGAFVLPDMISYFLVGGAGSIAFVTILTGYRDTGREAQGQRSLSVILSTMYLVLPSSSPRSSPPGTSAGGSTATTPTKPPSPSS